MTKKVLQITRPIVASPILNSCSKRYESYNSRSLITNLLIHRYLLRSDRIVCMLCDLFHFTERTEMGTDCETDFIHSSRSGLPNSIVNRIHLHIFGASINLGEVCTCFQISLRRNIIEYTCVHFVHGIKRLFQVGIRTKGIDAVLRKLVGIKGALADILMGHRDLSSIVSPLSEPDFGSIRSEIEDILSKVRQLQSTNTIWHVVDIRVQLSERQFGY